jgi:hypothetical protein
MSDTKPAATTTHKAAAVSELEYCLLKGVSPRTMLTRRKQGKTPPYFLEGRQIRYRLSDIADHEQNSGQ